MSDLQNVDPAVVAMKAEKPPAKTLRVPVKQPTFPLSTRFVAFDEESKTYTPTVNFETNAIVKCTDKYASVPRDSLKNTPVDAKEGEEIAEFPFPGEVFASIVHWCEKYGKDGKCESTFPQPVTHTDFTILLANDWEKNYYSRVLLQHDSSEVLFGTINAAEKFAMDGLLEFCIVGLSCTIRGKSDQDIMSTMHQSKDFTTEELASVDSKYTWFNEITKPQVHH